MRKFARGKGTKGGGIGAENFPRDALYQAAEPIRGRGEGSLKEGRKN